jgi:hypothetical protein
MLFSAPVWRNIEMISSNDCVGTWSPTLLWLCSSDGGNTEFSLIIVNPDINSRLMLLLNDSYFLLLQCLRNLNRQPSPETA